MGYSSDDTMMVRYINPDSLATKQVLLGLIATVRTTPRRGYSYMFSMIQTLSEIALMLVREIRSSGEASLYLFSFSISFQNDSFSSRLKETLSITERGNVSSTELFGKILSSKHFLGENSENTHHGSTSITVNKYTLGEE